MTDIVTYCDVNTCEECPRYGDDCDGDKRVEHTDYISRADAIEAVKDTILKRFNLADWYEEMLNCGVEIEDRIKALPSADAVQGEWEKTKLKDDMWICPACGSPLMTDDISELHFCPNCGARMAPYKGGDDE